MNCKFSLHRNCQCSLVSVARRLGAPVALVSPRNFLRRSRGRVGRVMLDVLKVLKILCMLECGSCVCVNVSVNFVFSASAGDQVSCPLGYRTISFFYGAPVATFAFPPAYRKVTTACSILQSGHLAAFFAGFSARAIFAALIIGGCEPSMWIGTPCFSAKTG